MVDFYESFTLMEQVVIRTFVIRTFLVAPTVGRDLLEQKPAAQIHFNSFYAKRSSLSQLCSSISPVSR